MNMEFVLCLRRLFHGATARVAHVRRELGRAHHIQFARSANKSRTRALSDSRRLASLSNRAQSRRPSRFSAWKKRGLFMALTVSMK